MKTKILSVAEIGIVLLAILALSRQGSFINLAYAAPDSYGDDINWIYTEQWNGSQWILVKNFTSSGDSARITDSDQVNFTAEAKFNVTFAADNGTAQSYTKMNITISFINGSGLTPSWNNLPMNQSSYSWNDTQFYHIIFYANWTNPLPTQGAFYNCSFNYQPYY